MHDRIPRPDQLEPIERAPFDDLPDLQLRRLQWTIRHAYDNVGHYRNSFDAAGVHPDDCKTLADLARFPFTTKADLRDNYPFGMMAVPQDKISRIHASSGTTGRATVVGYTQADIHTWSAVMARSIRASGGRPGDKVHVAYGYGLFTGGLGAHYGAEELGCTVIPVSGGMTERQATLIRDFEPDIIMATPSYTLAIIDELERQGIDPAATTLAVGIFGAEPWTDRMRTEIERRLGIHAVDIYGLSEIMGPGVANECIETKDGLHIWEDHFYPEVIDPVTGAVLPDGDQGELIFTTLTKVAMPVVRYRTRDLTRLLPGTARPMRRMERITGRSDDMIILRGVNLFPTNIEELILQTAALSPHFQCVLSRPDRLDELTVRVERRAAADPAAGDIAGAVLCDRIKNTIGVTVTVDVVAPGEVERSTGKVQRVVRHPWRLTIHKRRTSSGTGVSGCGDRGRDAASERWAVSGQHEAGVERLESGQRSQPLRGRVGECRTHRPQTGLADEPVVGHQCVASQQDSTLCHVERDAADRVARYRDNLRPAWHVERYARCGWERRHLGDRWRAEGTVPRHMQWNPQRGGAAHQIRQERTLL